MARGRKVTGWIVAVVVLLVVIWGLYLVFDDLSEEPANQLLLPALSLLLVVFVLALVGILVRNLVRLIVDRKRGIFGSKLRTKLVFFMLALVLVPATVLFYGSATVIKQTVEAILRTPLEDLAQQSDAIVEQWNDYFNNQTLGRARGIAEDIRQGGYLEPDRRRELEQLVSRWQREHELQLVRVTGADGLIAQAGDVYGAADGKLNQDLQNLIATLVLEAVRSKGPATRVDYLGDGLLAHAAVPIQGDAGTVESGRSAVVAVGILLPARLAGNLEGFAAAEQAYRQFRVQRRELVRLYLTVIGLIYLVTLFIATWIGFYLSRRITVPIHDLSAAAREISAGNLDVRVQTGTGDEVGMLVDSFNEMAGELQESRAVITRSTAELRRSNRALDERRRYIEALLANLSTAVMSIDPDGRITTANPAVRTILGIELMPGEWARGVFERQGLEPLAELLDRAASRGEGSRSDVTLQREHRMLHVAVQVSPLKSSTAEDIGTLVMVEDLTDLLRAQRAAAWREVAQRIAHEIKNPLTPIQLAAQRLRKKFAEGSVDLDRVVPDATESIEREVAGLKKLVDEFSRFARMPEISRRLVRFDEVVASVLALYEGVPTIRWELQLEEKIGEVLLDPQQMRRALINLIDNALAAMQGEGTIRINARAESDGSLRLELSDTGPGIPPQDRDKMFVPYFSRTEGGTGLGLAIVHKVVTDHEGTIRVEDNEPHGARFVIEIPA